MNGIRILSRVGYAVLVGLLLAGSVAMVSAESSISVAAPAAGGFFANGAATPAAVQVEAGASEVGTGAAEAETISAPEDARAETELVGEAGVGIEQMFDGPGDGDSFKSAVSGQIDLKLKRFGFDFFKNGGRLRIPCALMSGAESRGTTASRLIAPARLPCPRSGWPIFGGRPLVRPNRLFASRYPNISRILK